MRAVPRSCWAAKSALFSSKHGADNKANLDSIVRSQASASRGSSALWTNGGWVLRKSWQLADGGSSQPRVWGWNWPIWAYTSWLRSSVCRAMTSARFGGGGGDCWELLACSARKPSRVPRVAPTIWNKGDIHYQPYPYSNFRWYTITK
jgi:hypothetical protein